MYRKRVMVVCAALSFVMFAPRAEATPWLLELDGVLNSGPLAGVSFAADFIYRDSAPPGQGDGFTPIVHASITFDNQLLYSQLYPSGNWTPGLTLPAGVDSWIYLAAQVFGPHFFLPAPLLPQGLTMFGFDETRLAYDYGSGITVQQCSDTNWDGCTFSVTQLPDGVPESSSLLFGLTAFLVAAGMRGRGGRA